MTRSTALPSAVGAAALALTIVLAACAASPQASVPPSSAASSQEPVAGPTDFAAWTERQGFGGSSGLANVAKLVHWLENHRTEATTFDLDGDAHDIANLIAWLDAHPATSCWADYHTAVRASLASLSASYAAVRVEVDANRPVPAAMTTTMVAEAERMSSLPQPTGCR